ncbi:unnamed protein product, partial [Rotaria sordida]
LLNNGSRVK